MPKQPSSRRGRPTMLARISIDQIQAELSRRQEALSARRYELMAQLGAIDSHIAEFGDVGVESPRRGPGRPRRLAMPTGQPAGRGAKGRGRGGNERSLPVLLQSLLRGKTMSVPEMAEAAKKAGHKTKSKSFRTIVALALLNNRKMFKRVSRGQYTAK